MKTTMMMMMKQTAVRFISNDFKSKSKDSILIKKDFVCGNKEEINKVNTQI